MKIAIIGSRGYPSTYGGYETLVRRLAPSLVASGDEVTVFCRDREETGIRTWTIDGVRCRRSPGIDRRATSTLTFGASSSVMAAIEGFDSALVLNIANGFWLPLLNARGVPTAVNTDGVEWERAKWGKTARQVFKAGAAMSARHSTRLIADSRAMAAIYRARYEVDSTFIPYGADIITNHGKERIRKLGLEPRSYLLVVARMVPENNVDLILDAFELLGGTAPRLVVVGDSTYGSDIDGRLRYLAQRGSLIWLGHVADQDLLNDLWGNAALLVHGHSAGGTNPALLQAMGNGAPVIALDTPFNREVLADDRCLFPSSADSLAGLMDKVFNDPDLASGLSAHAKDRILAEYQWPSVLAAYGDLLAGIANGRTRG